MAIFDFLSRKKATPQDSKSLLREVQTQVANILNKQLYRFIGGAPLIPEADFDANVKAYVSNHYVYAIIARKATKAAEIGFKLERKTGDSWERVENHEILNLLEDPNPLMGRQEFFESMYTFLFATGNIFVYAPRLNSGKTLELWLSPSNLTEIVPGNDWKQIVRGYTVRYTGMTEEIPATDIMHVKYPNIDYDNGRELYGQSPLKALAPVIRKSDKAEQVMADGYENRGAHGLVYPDLRPDEALDDASIDVAQQSINDRVNNPDNVKKIITMASRVGYVNLAMSAVDLEVIEDKKLTLRDFCRAFRVPSVLYGDTENSSYNNLAEARKDEMVTGILPDVRRVADALNRWYVNPVYGKDYRLQPLMDDIEELQPDKAQEVAKLMNAVFIPVAEKQRMYGMDADPKLENVYISSSGMPINLTDDIADILRSDD